jgi:protein involved in polysaccharide export with SLBB domain
MNRSGVVFEDSRQAEAHKLYNIAARATKLKGLNKLRREGYILSCIALIVFFNNGSRISAQEASVMGTPQQLNDRIRTLSASSKPASHEYTIGNGDLLSVSVFDVPELSHEVRVSQSGTISIPLVPTRLHISGLTEIQAEQMIADVLQANGLVSHPEVGVMVKEHKSRPITVVGAVQHPMVYEADSSVNLLEVLAGAGGVSNDAGDTIIVTRARSSSFALVPIPEPSSSLAPGAAPGAESSSQDAPALSENDTTGSSNPTAFPSAMEVEQGLSGSSNPNKTPETTTPAGNTITINLNELLETGDMRNNIPLQAGDVVTVPHAGIVYVLGAVNRPGGFVMANDRSEMTTMKVLSLAGGLTRIAKLDHAVIIRKDDQGKQTETEVDLKKVITQQSEDIKMRASDVLYIPDNHVKEALFQALQIGLAVGTAVAIYHVAYH